MKIFNFPSISLKSLSPQLNVNLQQREKLAIAIAGAALLLFLVFQLLIFPLIDRRDRLRKEIITKTEDVQTIQNHKTEYLSLSRSSVGMENRIKKRPKTFTLFSFIDRLAGKSNIKKNIIYMKPSTANIKNSSYKLSTVEMKLNALTMDQLTTFLHGVEDITNVVWIKRISITRDDKNEGLLNTVLQVETFQR
jgi:general secretion pathway protein M